MKLTSVELHPGGTTEYATFSFRDPRRLNSYNVKSIDGLDAEEIIAKYYGSSGNTTDKFYSLVIQNRDVIVRLELNPDYTDNKTYSDLRDDLYRMIASSRTGLVELWFKNGDSVTAILTGFITRLEAPKFNKIQEVTLTLRTKEPMLKAPYATVVNVDDFDPASFVVTDTLSQAPHGFKMEVNVLADTPAMLISDPEDDRWGFQIDYIFEEDDVLYYSSELNDKYLYVIRDDTQIHIADKIAPGSIWPIMFPGENTFSLSNSTDLSVGSISYYATYWGV